VERAALFAGPRAAFSLTTPLGTSFTLSSIHLNGHVNLIYKTFERC